MTAPDRPAFRPGGVTWAGLFVVAGAAAVLSFASLRDLAMSCRITPGLAPLLPVTVDAGAAVATRAWLSRRAHPDAERFARWMTWGLLALTVVGNAAHQGMTANGVTPPWWVAVIVGAVPPAVVGAAVHLAVLLGRSDVSVNAHPAGVDVTDRAEECNTVPAAQPAAQPAAPDARQESATPPAPKPARTRTPRTGAAKTAAERKQAQRARARNATPATNGVPVEIGA